LSSEPRSQPVGHLGCAALAIALRIFSRNYTGVNSIWFCKATRLARGHSTKNWRKRVNSGERQCARSGATYQSTAARQWVGLRLRGPAVRRSLVAPQGIVLLLTCPGSARNLTLQLAHCRDIVSERSDLEFAFQFDVPHCGVLVFVPQAHAFRAVAIRHIESTYHSRVGILSISEYWCRHV
jgi:hypothetical protein